jgi:hypothetical protein
MSEDLIDGLWLKAKVSLATKVGVLRRWQAGGVGDAVAREVTHQLTGTLGSYRKNVAAKAAHELNLRLQGGVADAGGGTENRLIDLIEHAVAP